MFVHCKWRKPFFGLATFLANGCCIIASNQLLSSTSHKNSNIFFISFFLISRCAEFPSGCFLCNISTWETKLKSINFGTISYSSRLIERTHKEKLEFYLDISTAVSLTRKLKLDLIVHYFYKLILDTCYFLCSNIFAIESLTLMDFFFKFLI